MNEPQTYTIPLKAVSENEWRSELRFAPHRYDKHYSKFKSDVTMILRSQRNKMRYAPFTVPVEIRYTFFFRSTTRRDLDNYIGGAKIITDALKGIAFDDDNSARVSFRDTTIFTGADEDGIEIKITPQKPKEKTHEN